MNLLFSGVETPSISRLKLQWLAGSNRIAEWAGERLEQLRSVLSQPLWRHLPHRWLLRLGSPLLPIYARAARRRAGDGFARQHQAILATPTALPPHHRRQWRQTILDRALLSRNRTLVDELTRCAETLRLHVERIERDGGRVLLAPLHCVSDMASAVLCTRLGGPTWIVTHHRPLPGRDVQLARAGSDARFIHPAADDAVPRYQAAVRALRRREGRLVLFPDAPPEITRHLFERDMPTKGCRIFGRPALLHDGVAAMARMSGAHVLVFALRETGGRFALDVLATLPPDDVTDGLPAVIEAALRDRPDQWLLWHAPSFFHFRAGDQ